MSKLQATGEDTRMAEEKISNFIEHLAHKGRDASWQKLAREVLSAYLLERESASDALAHTRSFSAQHIAGSDDAYRRIVILFWYCNYHGDHPSATYLLTMLGTTDVLESQKARLAEIHGISKAEEVFGGLDFPSLGSDLADYPGKIDLYLQKLCSSLDEDACRNVLAGNHHQLDPEQFAEEKQRFEEAPSIEVFLRGKHERLVANLAEHASTGKLWFEQRITDRVVDYVRQHQEIQTGVLEGKRLIVDKIPYDPENWLGENDPDKKRYLACHCPFVRESIPAAREVSSLWCYCTGGFTKLLWDYIYGQPLKVELLSSVLDGSPRCRFAITLPL
jgi:hypothetical protein